MNAQRIEFVVNGVSVVGMLYVSAKQDLWLESKGQIDFYDDPVLIAAAADALAAHFGEHLGPH